VGGVEPAAEASIDRSAGNMSRLYLSRAAVDELDRAQVESLVSR
jgi:hypothetical protein